jgi:ankyrin repeat protein
MIRKMQQFLEKVANMRSSGHFPGSSHDVEMADQGQDDQTGHTRTSEMQNISKENLHINQQLLSAATRGDAATLRSLIKAGTDLKTKDSEGRTCMYLACEVGHLHVVHELMRYAGDHIVMPAHNGKQHTGTHQINQIWSKFNEMMSDDSSLHIFKV